MNRLKNWNKLLFSGDLGGRGLSGPTMSKKSDAVFKFVVKLSSGKAGASELRKGSVFSNIFSFNVPHLNK